MVSTDTAFVEIRLGFDCLVPPRVRCQDRTRSLLIALYSPRLLPYLCEINTSTQSTQQRVPTNRAGLRGSRGYYLEIERR